MEGIFALEWQNRYPVPVFTLIMQDIYDLPAFSAGFCLVFI